MNEPKRKEEVVQSCSSTYGQCVDHEDADQVQKNPINSSIYQVSYV